MKIIKAIASIFFLTAILAFGSASQAFQKANADYAAGSYPEAVQSYEKLLERDGARVSVLRNLGNAYFKMEKYGRAILSFERALVIKPRDPDLLANLKLAQDQAAVYPVRDDSFWTSFLARYSARSWSMVALASAILLPLAALGWVFRKGKIRLWIAIFVVADLATLGLSFAGMDARSGERDRGIVIANSATVRISPFDKADTRGSLAEGREVSLGNKNNGYLWATSDDGSQEGWVAKDEVLPVIPGIGNQP